MSWQPAGVGQNAKGNTRFAELSPTQQSHFVELTGPKGTAIIFTHDIIHTSWHVTDTYRRVLHCTFGTGSGAGEVAAPDQHDADEEAWLRYLLRDQHTFALPPAGVNLNYHQERTGFNASKSAARL